jgi:alpha-1,6-mannosyltransferase
MHPSLLLRPVIFWLFPLAWLGLFSGMVWWFKFHLFPAEDGLSAQLNGLFLLCATTTVPYLLLVRRAQNPFSWRVVSGALVAACVCTPSFLETDQFRYIWDGLVAAKGLNPFRFAPDEIAWRAEHFWAAHINHPHLTTIYPPVAQLLFQLSTYANPFFWNQELGWELGPAGGAGSLFQAEFGLKLILGLLMSFVVWSLREARWDLIVFHPLFLIHVLSNSHVDALMMPGLALFVLTSMTCRATPLFAWMTAVLAKWLPLIFLPLVFLRISLRHGIRAAGAAMVLCFAVAAVAIGFYMPGSAGRLFESTGIYAQNWSFFGFGHRLLADIFLYFGFLTDPIGLARYWSVGVSCLLLGFIVLLYLRAAVSYRLALVLSLLAVLVFFPTLHPWYLLGLLVVGVRHLRTLPVLWVWPLLALGSHAFYVEMKDPVLVRLMVYVTVSILLIFSLRRILRRCSVEAFGPFSSPLRVPVWRKR